MKYRKFPGSDVDVSEVDRAQVLSAQNFGQDRDEPRFRGTMEIPEEVAIAA